MIALAAQIHDRTSSSEYDLDHLVSEDAPILRIILTLLGSSFLDFSFCLVYLGPEHKQQLTRKCKKGQSWRKPACSVFLEAGVFCFWWVLKVLQLFSKVSSEPKNCSISCHEMFLFFQKALGLQSREGKHQHHSSEGRT